MRFRQLQGTTGLHKDSGTFRLATSTKTKQRSYISKKTRGKNSWAGRTQKGHWKPKLETESPLDQWIHDIVLNTHDLLIYINHLQQCFFKFPLIKNILQTQFSPLNSLFLSKVWIGYNAEFSSSLTIKYAWILQSLMLYCILTVTWKFVSGPRECPQLSCNNKLNQVLPIT